MRPELWADVAVRAYGADERRREELVGRRHVQQHRPRHVPKPEAVGLRERNQQRYGQRQ